MTYGVYYNLILNIWISTRSVENSIEMITKAVNLKL